MSSIFSWFSDILKYLGLINKEHKLLFIGLNYSGKTTLMYMLKDGKVDEIKPTLHPNVGEFTFNGANFIVYDLSGFNPTRRVLPDYFVGMDAIVFVVDASDQERIDESRKELAKVLNDKYISSVPVLILGNKIDKPDALSEDQLKNCLGISEITTGKNQADLLSRPLELFMCSVMRRQGYEEGFRWLSQYLN